jgi:hypothetical protein
MPPFPRTAGLAPAAVLIALALPSPASAGTYKQYTCKLPDGTPAATDGWVGDAAAAFFQQANDCASGGSLRVAMSGDGLASGASRAWRWTAPADTQLQAADLYRAWAVAAGDATAAPAAKLLAGSQTLESSGANRTAGSLSQWNDPSNHFTNTNAALGSTNAMTAVLGCFGSTGSACPYTGTIGSELRIHAATFSLSDSSTPTVANVKGTLLAGGAKQGVQALSFDASDAGGGLYRVLVDVDGQPASAAVVDSNNGRCADVAPDDGDAYEFQYAVPCRLQIGGIQAALDTRALSDGDHLVRVRVEDAAGNRSAVYGPATMTVANGAPTSAPTTTTTPPATVTPIPTPIAAPVETAPAPGATNGQGGGAGARLSTYAHGTVRVRYGRSASIGGRLLGPNGEPVRGAVVDVYAQTRVRGAKLVRVGVVTSAGDGSFSYAAPVGASRLVRFAYRAHLQDTDFAQTTDVEVSVIPRVTLSLSRSHLRNGQTLRYRGRIAGPNTKGGLAEVRVRGKGRWITVCVSRVRSAGRFGCTYRFRSTHRPTRYVFRAVVRRQGGLPYEPGQSGTRSVRVRP